MSNTYSFISEIQKKLTQEQSRDELLIMFFSVLYLLDDRKKQKLNSSVTLHLLMVRINAGLDFYKIAVRELYYAQSADPFHPEVYEYSSWLKCELKVYLLKKDCSLNELDLLIKESEETDFIDEEIYLAFSQALGALGEAERSQGMRTKAQVISVLAGGT